MSIGHLCRIHARAATNVFDTRPWDSFIPTPPNAEPLVMVSLQRNPPSETLKARSRSLDLLLHQSPRSAPPAPPLIGRFRRLPRLDSAPLGRLRGCGPPGRPVLGACRPHAAPRPARVAKRVVHVSKAIGAFIHRCGARPVWDYLREARVKRATGEL